MNFPKVIIGMWQVAGRHGPIDETKALDDMKVYFDSGFRAWDLADHYGPAEDLIGRLRKSLGSRADELVAFTKWVPTDLETRSVPDVEYSLAFVESEIDKSLNRMKVDSLDLLQFHWWDYQDQRLYDALDSLCKLREKSKIKEIGLTNFSPSEFDCILDKGYPIVSHQVRHSITDPRASKGHIQSCAERGVQILSFGILAGGLLSEYWIGKSAPSESEIDGGRNVHLKLINRASNWEWFQGLLQSLQSIATDLNVSLSNVAAQYILQKSSNISLIIGARLGVSSHLEDNLRIGSFRLTPNQVQVIDSKLDRADDLNLTLGEIGSEYRGAKL